MWSSPVRICVLISYEDISHIGLEPTHIISFYLNYLCKDCLQTQPCSEVLGVGLQHLKSGGGVMHVSGQNGFPEEVLFEFPSK